MPELPPPLPAEILARRDHLPVKPAPVELAGDLVTLRPLELDADVAPLHAVSCGAPFTLGTRSVGAYDPEAVIWRFMAGGPFATAAQLRDYLARQDATPDARPFTVRDRASSVPVGIINLMANQPQHLKIELGAIWYGPIAQRTGASREATHLLLAHAFALGYQRVEWKCNALNEASRRAALSYGFRFEGIQDAHYIIKDRRRDTAWYRMLAHEFAATM